jgi:hypothetical protein
MPGKMRFAALMLSCTLLGGCAQSPPPLDSPGYSNVSCELPGVARRVSSQEYFSRQAQALQQSIQALREDVDEGEAALLADIALRLSLKLREQYGASTLPLMHNVMVNVGLKERGLCHHWTKDLVTQLRKLELQTLELYWSIAHPWEFFREHSAVVVGAKGAPFEQGLVLDAWRHSGCLYWTPVRMDKYPWRNAIQYSTAAAP